MYEGEATTGRGARERLPEDGRESTKRVETGAVGLGSDRKGPRSTLLVSGAFCESIRGPKHGGECQRVAVGVGLGPERRPKCVTPSLQGF